MMWKSVGQGTSAGERDLEGILGRIPRWQGMPLRYCPISGGISNANWRVSSGTAQDSFVKVPGRGTEMFIARDTANEASRKAEACGFGAEVIDYLPADGVEVFAFVEGYRASSNLDFLRPAVRGNAVRALRAFNDSGPLSQTKTVLDMIEEHVAQVAEVGARVPDDFAWMMRRFAEAKAALLASGLDLAPCMNDTLAGNFLIDADDRVMLVDFEYASNNDRAYELALWFDEMAFDQTIEREMIEAYFGRWDLAIDARISVLKALADLKWATWAMIQEAVSLLDFDFYKYGTWKHMRARTLFHHADWPQWLKRL